MTTVVIDGNDLDAIVADATGAKIEEKPAEKVSEPEVKAEAKVEAKEPEVKEDPEDVEGDDGLTPRQKKELTSKMQTAIGKKHRMMKEAEEFAADQYSQKRLAEQKAEQYEREIQRLKTQLQGANPQPTEETKPKREAFETQEAFQEALIDWRVDQKIKATEAEAAKQKAEEAQQQLIETVKSKVAKAIELVPDFIEKTEAAEVRVPDVVAVAMQESELFAELAYYLADHQDEVEEMRKMTPHRAVVALGKIESTLKPFAASEVVKAKPNGKDDSQKPSSNGTQPSQDTGSIPSRPRPSAPIRPLSSGSAVQVSKAEAEMTPQEALAAWQKAKHVNLERRKRH